MAELLITHSHIQPHDSDMKDFQCLWAEEHLEKKGSSGSEQGTQPVSSICWAPLWASGHCFRDLGHIREPCLRKTINSKYNKWGFPGGTVVKDLSASAGDAGDTSLIPGSRSSPGEEDGNPLQYSCLENCMDRGAWWATVYEVTKSRTRLMTKHST